MDDHLKRREEAKRDVLWNAAKRWRVIPETLSHADVHGPVPRNGMARWVELQRIKLAATACGR